MRSTGWLPSVIATLYLSALTQAQAPAPAQPFQGFPPTPSTVAPDRFARDPEFGTLIVPDRLLIRVKAGTGIDAAAELIKAFGGKVIGGVAELGVLEVAVLGSHTPEGFGPAAQALESSQFVEFFDTIRVLQSLSPPPVTPIPEGISLPPASGDPLPAWVQDPSAEFRRWYAFGLVANWPWQMLGFPDAWIGEAAPVQVGMIDAGLDAGHPDIAGSLAGAPTLSKGPWDEAQGDLQGTHNAGLIAAANDDKGITGICPSAKLHVIEAHTTLDTLAALVALTKAGCKVINDGMGIAWDKTDGPHPDKNESAADKLVASVASALEPGVAFARDHGVLIVTPAGNDALDTRLHPYARLSETYSNILVVGATGFSLDPTHPVLAGYSGRGEGLTITAPGGEVLTTQDHRTAVLSCGEKHGYRLAAGTGPASAIVAGASALLWAKYPALTGEDVRKALLEGAKQAGGKLQDMNCYALRLDSALAIAEQLDAERQAAAPPEQARLPQDTPPATSDQPQGETIAATQAPPTETPKEPVIGDSPTPPAAQSVRAAPASDVEVVTVADARSLSRAQADSGRATWAPDASRLVFDTDRDGNPEIYAINSDGYRPLRLTNDPATDITPVWSPDGKRIAFTSNRAGNFNIYVMDATGAGVTQLTEEPGWDASPAWSADSSQLAFESDRDGQVAVWVMNADGSEPARVTDTAYQAIQPCWSPVGNALAFVANRDGSRDVYVIGADGSELRPLTQFDGDVWYPAWSPDGERLAFGNQGDICLINADGSGLQRLTNGETVEAAPAWSPDGTRLSFHSRRGEFWQVYVVEVPPPPAGAIQETGPLVPPTQDTPPAPAIDQPTETATPATPEGPTPPTPVQPVQRAEPTQPPFEEPQGTTTVEPPARPAPYEGPTEPVTLKGVEYETLPEALAKAQPGDSIHLGRGVYEANPEINGVSLIGAGKHLTTLRWDGGGSPLRIKGGTGTVQDLAVKRAAGTDWTIKIGDGVWQIVNCLVEGGDEGIVITGGTVAIMRTEVWGAGHNGILVMNEAEVDVQDCDLHDMRGAGGTGLSALDAGQVRVVSTRSYANPLHGIYAGGEATLEAIDCLAHGNRSIGIAVMDRAEATIQDSESAHNGNHGIYIGAGSKATLKRNRVHHNQGHGIVAAASAVLIATKNQSWRNNVGIWIDNGVDATLDGNIARNNTVQDIIDNQ